MVHDVFGSYALYSLINFSKLHEVKIPKIDFIMYDWNFSIIMNCSKISGF